MEVLDKSPSINVNVKIGPVIITSPHSKCPDYSSDKRSESESESIERKCDIISGRVSSIIYENLKSVKRKCIHIPADEYRDKYDLNRKWSRQTPWRKELSSKFSSSSYSDSPSTVAKAKYREKIPLVVDIHSFPTIWEPEGKDILFKRGDISPEIILMKGPGDKIIGNFSLSDSIYKYLVYNGIYCKVIEDVKVLDILNNSHEFGIPGILLEFNESLGHEEKIDRLNYICNIVCQSIDDIMFVLYPDHKNDVVE